MTSGIADYAAQPAFGAAIAANPRTRFTAARLVSYAAGQPLGPKGWAYSDTNYILAQMIIERATRDSYTDQLSRRIIRPLGLRTLCDAPYTCPPADAARIPAGYFYMPAAPPLLGKRVPSLALTWAQGAGGKPIRTTTLADPSGFGLGTAQLTTRPTGTAWYYQGGTLGYRVVHFYFPRSGIIIAIAANSATDINTNDDLPATAIAVYQTLLKAGAAHSG
ncbi:MAG: serine hydrolase [Streptosporangiaceae bacterium]